MFKRIDYMKFETIVQKIMQLELKNRMIDIKKLKKLPALKNELLKEFISTNNIEGDIVSMKVAKTFLKDELNESQITKRWIGIKYAHNIIWSDNYLLNLEYIQEAHRALMRNVDIPGGIWKQKLNQVGSLITSLPEDVPRLMLNLITSYLSVKLSEGPSITNIIPFISEFLAIHPFENGNGRMSRLLMNRELYNAGFKFTKYISISKFIWEKREEYINALEARNNAWASKTQNPTHLVDLFNVILDCLIKAADYALKFQHLKRWKKDEFKIHAQTIFAIPLSISDVMKKMGVGNSKETVLSWLREMIDEGIIKKQGNLKSTKYIRTN